jgi:DNA-binding response OmpR family regulator
MNNLPSLIIFDDDESNLKFYDNRFKDNFSLKGIQNPHLYPQVLTDNLSAILIDVIMPVMDGVQLYSEIRSHQKYNGCPIIFISGSTSEEVMLSALNIGGEDFLNRSMKKDEMIIRIKNKIDSFKNYRHVFQLGNVKLNTQELKLYHKNQILDLTLTEMKILKFLLREHPRLTTREEINQEVWPGQNVIPTTLNTHLSNLRNKLNEWEYEIQFIKSKGVELTLKV